MFRCARCGDQRRDEHASYDVSVCMMCAYPEFSEKYELDDSVKSEHYECGGILETYGEDLEKAKDIFHKSNKRVWTVIDCGGSHMVVTGMAFVNRVNYLITKEEWKDENEEYLDQIFDLDELDDEELEDDGPTNRDQDINDYNELRTREAMAYNKEG